MDAISKTLQVNKPRFKGLSGVQVRILGIVFPHDVLFDKVNLTTPTLKG